MARGRVGAFLRGALAFVRDSLRPIRQLNNLVQELGVTVVGAAVLLWAGKAWGWGAASMVLLSLLVVLLLIEGGRREYAARSVDVSFDACPPELLKADGRWKLAVAVIVLVISVIILVMLVNKCGKRDRVIISTVLDKMQ